MYRYCDVRTGLSARGRFKTPIGCNWPLSLGNGRFQRPCGETNILGDTATTPSQLVIPDDISVKRAGHIALSFSLHFSITPPDPGIRTKRLQSSDSSFKRLSSFYVPKFNPVNSYCQFDACATIDFTFLCRDSIISSHFPASPK